MSKRKIVVIGAVLIGVIFVKQCYFGSNLEQASKFVSSAIKEGELKVEVLATGTLQPEEVVDVGAQIAGQIREFGVDSTGAQIDFGSKVEQGTVLARIDDTVYQAQAAEAEAGAAKARAEVLHAKAKSAQAAADWERAKGLGPSGGLSASQFDGYKAENAVANANVAVAEASLAEAEAALARARQNLSYTTIVSPVQGIIIDRKVNIGQTVVAALNAPSLFLIAKDLRKMQVWAAVNEADIGRIYSGQKATFAVDAHPGRVFAGIVRKIRLNASMTQNVVTYTAEIATDNDESLLLPYLTTNVRFEVAEATVGLLVPSAALRFLPEPSDLKNSRDFIGYKQKHDAVLDRLQRLGLPGEKTNEPIAGVVWQENGEHLRAIDVAIGVGDRSWSAISSGELKPGELVVVGRNSQETSAMETPFTPKLRRREAR